ncbi:ABC transporter ATP-binding protein [Ornithinimicrobium sp. LYQ92]|uniref:ABC transporter ATP-binding protein n=1 Tax=Serinicoccus sp. LYQ92 TaxID=3378798 RepID=UPI003855310F
MTTQEHLLDVRGLDVAIDGPAGPVKVVRDLSFSLDAGSTTGIVGESGSGKSMTASAIMGILPEVATASGSVRYRGTDLLTLSERRRRAMSGPELGFIFQEPMSALHPMLSIGEQMTRPLRHHLGLSKGAARTRCEELLDQVGIPPERGVLRSYVHELSGGMRQRVMIAMAISCAPSLLIADEPTTALDTTVQKQILDLLMRLRDELDLAVLLISHDLGLVARYADHVVVMLDGLEMEQGPTVKLITEPQHAYTRGLLEAAPRLGRKVHRLPVIDTSRFDTSGAGPRSEVQA